MSTYDRTVFEFNVWLYVAMPFLYYLNEANMSGMGLFIHFVYLPVVALFVLSECLLAICRSWLFFFSLPVALAFSVGGVLISI